MYRTYDRQGVRFACWHGHGRDPEVAYLDARLLVIASSELGTSGLMLYASGVSYNTLGGERRGDIDPAALHRLAHAATDAEGSPYLGLGHGCEAAIGPAGLCEVAAREPRPGTPAEPTGSFVIEKDFALQWVVRDDVARGRAIGRAVYMDERFLLEAASGSDGRPRAWPARGLMAHGLQFAAPAATELGLIEDRIASATGVTG